MKRAQLIRNLIFISSQFFLYKYLYSNESMFDSIWLFVIILTLGFFLNMFRRAITSNVLKTILRVMCFIGIIIHELCHYVMCLLMGSVPSEIKVSYRNMNGHVIHKRGNFMQTFLISLAPLLISSYIAWFCLDSVLNASIIWYYRWLAGIMVISILLAAGPSSQDLKCIRMNFSRDTKKACSQIIIVTLSGILVYFITIDLSIPTNYSFIYFVLITFGYFILKYVSLGLKITINWMIVNEGHNIPSRHNRRVSISFLKPKRKIKISKNSLPSGGLLDFLNEEDDNLPEAQLEPNITFNNFIEIIKRSGKRKRMKIELGQW